MSSKTLKLKVKEGHNKQHEFLVEGVKICFPHEPYKVQVDYIGKLLECLQRRENGLLESPTGTGKTLSLLCGALAWLENHRAYQQLSMITLEQSQGCNSQLEYQKKLSNQLGQAVGSFESQNSFGLAPTKIIYSSRTHSQLSQVVQELKKTSYNRVPSVVLGSRDQLCLLPEVANLESNAAKLHACRARVKSRTCQYYLNMEQKAATEPDFRKPEVLDIEDLMKLGTKHRCCPYYTAKEIKKKADVIFAPYNYLIDPKTRKAQSIELQNNVIIFDEAHNIESVCEDGMSFQIKSKDIACSISEVTKLLEKFASLDKPDPTDYSSPVNLDVSIDDLASLKVTLTEIERILDDVAFATSLDKGIIKNGGYIFEVLSRAGINSHTATNIQSVIEQVMVYVSENQAFGSMRNAGLVKFSEMLEVIFAQIKSEVKNVGGSSFDQHYKICISEDKVAPKKGQQDVWAQGANNDFQYNDFTYWKNNSSNSDLKKNYKRSWKLDCWCLSPERSMRDLINQGIHCMILTSGTLSPLKSFQAELGVPFPVQLENPHIINPGQVLIAIVKNGPDGTNLLANYANRENPVYLKSLGMAISNFCTSIPKGLLVFFPSYSVMSNCVEKWKSTPLFAGLNAKKTVFVEPRTKDAFADCLEQYSNSVEDPALKGAALFGVCRGKVSEGIDFANDHARGVVITGIPFAPFYDERVKLKKQYLNENKNKGLSGDEWYMLQAVRAVNQAIGRVIRHKNDFGAVLLCDSRFDKKEYTNQLSKWVRGHVKTYTSFGTLQKSLIEFFKRHNAHSETIMAPNLKTEYPTSSKQITYKLQSAEKEADDEPATNLMEMYGGACEKSKHTKLTKKMSVFDAFNVVDNGNKTNISEESTDCSSKRSQLEETSPRLNKKRKINVLPKNIFGDPILTGEAASSQSISDDKIMKVQNLNKQLKEFSEKVKQIHGKEGISKLHKSVRKAKESNNVSCLVDTLVELTSSMPNREDIFKSVVMLLPLNMRNDFLEKVKDFFIDEFNTAICPYCKNIIPEYEGSASSKCFHLCCLKCWKEILKTTKKCPICHVSIKKKHVKEPHPFGLAPLSMQNFLNPKYTPQEITELFLNGESFF